MIRDHYSFDLDKFISKEKNILFITGYMGSGKTTLSRQYAEKYDAKCISLDIAFASNNFSISAHENDENIKTYRSLLIGAKCYLMDKDGNGIYTTKWMNMTTAQRCEVIITQAIKQCSSTNRIIIEGVQLYHYAILYPLFKNQPLCIMKTSINQSNVSSFSRDRNQGVRLIPAITEYFSNKKYYARQLQLYKEFINKVIAERRT